MRRYGVGYNNGGGTTAAAAAASLVVDTFAAYAAAATSSVVQAGADVAGSVPPPYDTAATNSNYVADSTTPAASSTTPSSAVATSTYGSDMEAAAVPDGADNLMASVSGSTGAVSSGEYGAERQNSDVRERRQFVAKACSRWRRTTRGGHGAYCKELLAGRLG